MKFPLICFLFFGLTLTSIAQQNATPSFEQWISLKQAGGVQVSPDGKHLVYTVTSTNWSANNYDTEVWLSRDGGKPFQLTQTQNGSSNAAAFSPDSKWISFLADRGNKTQLFLVAAEGGEAFAITN